MAYGDSPHDQTLKRAWEEFCDRLKEAGELVFRDPAPSTPLDRAAGFEYLSRQIGRGLDVALEHNDPLHPDLRWNQQPIRKYGGDNPDAVNLRPGSMGSTPIGWWGTAERPPGWSSVSTNPTPPCPGSGRRSASSWVTTCGPNGTGASSSSSVRMLNLETG